MISSFILPPFLTPQFTNGIFKASLILLYCQDASIPESKPHFLVIKCYSPKTLRTRHPAPFRETISANILKTPSFPVLYSILDIDAQT